MTRSQKIDQNNLNQATSPYLAQHAENPVHWQEWSQEVLEQARKDNKPLLVSIGYAACHWCHVMAHESFENKDIAALMNKYFVNIKIDREERPDLDHIYQSALSMMGQQGGWPLTIFCTPEGKPFWGGTYFPAEAKYGRPGFDDVLARIAEIYKDKPADVSHNAKALGKALEDLGRSKSGDPGLLGSEVLDEAGDQILTLIDIQKGGVKGAPKFPNPCLLDLLWGNYTRRGEQSFKQAVTHSLKKMGSGGMYDHVGGGFARYSVDEDWLVPHFEKMLYDNALLTDLMTLVWQDTKDPFFKRKISHTIGWVLEDMRVSEGKDGPQAFGSSYDADSEGVEGKYYVWSAGEIDSILDPQIAPIFKQTYGMSEEGNFEEAGEGANILNRLGAGEDEDEDTDMETQLQLACESLLAHRKERVAPHFDGKVLADWNGMMITALARAGRVFEQDEWKEAALQAYDFIVQNLQKDKKGTLWHSWHSGRAAHRGLADDYAWMIRAALQLYTLEGEKSYLDAAQKWAQILEERFWDTDEGGYFLNDREVTDIPCRPKVIHDSAIPGANGMMVENLGTLAALLPEGPWEERRKELIKAFAAALDENLYGLFSYLSGIDASYRLIKIEVSGPANDESAQALREVLRGHGRPEILWIDRPDQSPAEAVICQNKQCFEPVKNPEKLKETLKDPGLRKGECFT